MRQARARALKVFTVGYHGIRIQVRVMPHAKDVYSELSGGGKWRMDKDLPSGLFIGNIKGRFTGTIVLAGNSDLTEVVPHEVFHAVLWKFGSVHTANDEPAAYAIGILTSRILAKLVDITTGE